MTDVTASIQYKINFNNKFYTLTQKQYQVLLNIQKYNSFTVATEKVGVSYRTTLNYISKMEIALGTKIVSTNRGGSGGGGHVFLTEEGLSILNECKKVEATLELHNDVNEIKTKVANIDGVKGVMTIKMDDFEINAPLNKEFNIGDEVLALISYDNIFLMLEPQTSSIRNILKGTIIGLKLENEIVRTKIDVNGVILCSDITVSAFKDLNLAIGTEVYVGFKAMSVATLKL